MYVKNVKKSIIHSQLIKTLNTEKRGHNMLTTNNTAVTETPVTTIEFKMTANRIKGVHADNTKYDFLAFSGATKNGKKCKFKMTKTCNNVPKDEGVYLVTIERTAINLDKSSIYTEYWVKDIVSVKPFEIVETPLTDDDLPF